jgi:plastocyanin
LAAETFGEAAIRSLGASLIRSRAWLSALALGCGIVCLLFVTASSAPILDGAVVDDKGNPVKDAIVFMTAIGAESPPARARTGVMNQHDKEFVPYVLPIEIGTTVEFPNKDNLKHHVYSFSEPKKFELPLYSGQAPRSILFNKPGVIVLGCNIHDWMLAFILVLQTPYFATTDSRGTLQIDGLPVGNYEARVWHPLMRQESDQTTQRLALSPSEPANLRFVIALKRDTRRPRPIIPQYDRQTGA